MDPIFVISEKGPTTALLAIVIAWPALICTQNNLFILNRHGYDGGVGRRFALGG
jgi:hypothetical protein